MDKNENYRLLRELVVKLIKEMGLFEESKSTCCGITFSQCQVLSEIGEAGALSLRELSSRMGLDDSTLSRAVNNLVLRKLCTREAGLKDRRYVSIRLSDSGLEMLDKVERGANGYYMAIFESLPESKRGQVLESLELLTEAVIKSESSGGGCCD